MEGISKAVKRAEIKKQNLRKTMDSLHDHASSVLFLTLQWKELEDHFNSSVDFIKEREKGLLSIQDSIENNFKELKSRNDELRLAQASIKGNFEAEERRLGLVREEVMERFREVERKEMEFEAKQKVEMEERCAEIERVQRVLATMQRSIEESLREMEMKEKGFEVLNRSIGEKSRDLLEIQQLIDGRFREMEVREKGFDECFRDFKVKEKRLEERFQEMELKERQFEERCRELEWREKGIEEKSGEFELKDREFKGCIRELILKEKRVEEFYEGLKRKEKQLEERFKEFEERDKQFEVRRKDSELHDKRFEEWSKDLELSKNIYEAQCKELELKEKQFEERCKELELKGKKNKELEEQSEGLELKEKQNEERVEELVLKEKEFASSLHSKITMNGKNLQMYLYQHRDQHDSLRNEVFEALKLSSNPAKLVLEAMQEFYPPCVNKIVGKRTKVRVLRKSWILFLEQLMKVSPHIKPEVKKEAMELATDWFKKINAGSGSSLEVLGFLLLLASYGLASAFDADELLKLLENVVQPSPAPELWQSLGFTDKIPGFIEILIKREQPLEAIRYIYAFDRIEEFPPVPLLEGYLSHIDKVAKKCYNKGNTLLRQQNLAINKLLQDMRAIVRCIENHKLESVRSPQYLNRQIATLEKLIVNIEVTKPVLGCKVQTQEQNVEKCIAPTTAGAPAPVIQSQQQKSNKRPWIAISAETARNDSVGAEFAKQASCNILSSVEIEHLSSKNLQNDRMVASSSPSNRPDPNYVSVSMDGRGLRLLLDEQIEYDLMHTKVSNALQSVPDPAELVLNAINGFRPPNLEGVKGFKLEVSNSSCILLLKLLGGVSPQIKPQVQKEAMIFAIDWKSKLKSKREDQFEVVCLLQFLAAYGLVSSFDADEILGLFDNEAPECCKDLGLADLIPYFIQNLIDKEKWLEAIKHIFALDLVDKFPPVPLLKDYLRYSKKKAEEFCKEENYSLAVKAIDIELVSLKAVTKRIMDCNFEAEYWSKILEEHITILEQWKENMSEAPSSAAVASSLSIPQPQQQNIKKRRRIALSTKAPLNASVGATSSIHPIRPHQSPAGFLIIDGTPYSNTSGRSLTPDNRQMSSYYYNMNPYYPRDALTRPDYYNGSLPLDGSGSAPLELGYYNLSRDALTRPDYYNGSLPLDGSGSAPLELGYYNLSALGRYGLPPYYHP